MNYLAHAWPILRDPAPDPYELAGVAVPDWLGVAARRTKCRSKMAAPLARDSDPRVAAIARGVVRHHADDAWFHESRAFNELSLRFAKRLRDSLAEGSGMRPWFLGHILVEMLLDDELSRQEPGLLDRYYKLIAQAEAQVVANAVERMCGKQVERLAEWIVRFAEVRFLLDYATDEGLTLRLNQVMARVRLPALPERFGEELPALRRDVSENFNALITPSA